MESKISGTYHELVGRKHAFTYDHQGNRKTHSRNSHTTTYTPNNLNQYTARTNHGFLLVEGTSTNATVKVYETGSTEDTATRKNNYYFRDWDPDTTSTTSDYPEINIKEGTRVSDTKNAWIPVVSESPTYDANGNLTGDALWSYTYDEENRLIQMTETSAAATAGFPDTTITFKYDYLGRRVEKKVVRGTTTETHLRFVWRGWLLVAELNAASNNALVKTYTWGPDISGSFGGAGGNGGVLIFRDHTRTDNESFFPAYDAHGNVTGLIDTSGNLVAAYEYDPFGKLIRYAGTRSTSMSLLYGTKYLDMETGLIYYGYRYYDPRQGRFINRDPIGEEGGINLYGFVGNSPVNAIDYLGLSCGSRPTRPYIGIFARRDGDEKDRYDKELERWEEDYQKWLECRRDERIRGEPGWWGPSGDGSDIYVLNRFEVVETYGNDYSINTSRILTIGRWVFAAPLSYTVEKFIGAYVDRSRVSQERIITHPLSQSEEGINAKNWDFSDNIFEKDKNGNIIIRTKGETIRRVTNDPGPNANSWDVNVVELKGINGNWYEAFKWTGGHRGGITNCHGSSCAAGQFWINDIKPLLNDFFVATDQLTAGILVVWGGGLHSAVLTTPGSSLSNSIVFGLAGQEQVPYFLRVDTITGFGEPQLYKLK